MNPRLFVLGVILAAFVVGGVFLATRDVPSPRHAVEKVIGNDRFFK